MAVVKMLALTLAGPQEETEVVARQMVLRGGFQPIPLDLLVSDRKMRARVGTPTDNPYDTLLTKVASVWHAAGETLPEPSPILSDRSFTLEKACCMVEAAVRKLDLWIGESGTGGICGGTGSRKSAPGHASYRCRIPWRISRRCGTWRFFSEEFPRRTGNVFWKHLRMFRSYPFPSECRVATCGFSVSLSQAIATGRQNFSNPSISRFSP